MEHKIKVKKLSDDACLPEYALDCDIAFDVRANETVSLGSLEQKEIGTGIAIEIPQGYIGLVRNRFGIVSKYGAHVIAGTFDSSYREEVTIMMINFGDQEIQIEQGMRIAQIVLVPVTKMNLVEVKELTTTKRTGKKHGLTG